MPPQAPTIILSIYAVLLIAGGLMGYLKAKSRPSLIAGTASGLIAFGAAAWSWSGGPGSILGLVLSIAMAIVFGIRLSKSGKFMPSGLLLTMSLVVAAFLAYTLIAKS